jgi:hypothetical protein
MHQTHPALLGLDFKFPWLEKLKLIAYPDIVSSLWLSQHHLPTGPFLIFFISILMGFVIWVWYPSQRWLNCYQHNEIMIQSAEFWEPLYFLIVYPQHVLSQICFKVGTGMGGILCEVMIGWPLQLQIDLVATCKLLS